MNEHMEVIEARDEVLACQYDRTAKDFLRMAKEWADKGVCAHYYESAYRCCVRAESFELLAADLRRPKLVRLETEKAQSWSQ